MSSLRHEIEQAMGLRFPERNGEALVRFEESMEIPVSAESLMRGPYRDPDEVRRGFNSLHQETASILDILLPRKARLREWVEQLPEQPKEAEQFLRETSEQLLKQDRRRMQIERELLDKLQESGLHEVFPLPLSAFGIGSFQDKSVKIYLRPIGRLAEILQLNPEQLRQTIRIHFLFFLLLITGQDLDGQTFTRGNEETVTHMLVTFFTSRFLKDQSSELAHCYNEWVKVWNRKALDQGLTPENSVEKVRAAMIFWRRSIASWEECWNLANLLDKRDGLKFNDKFNERKNFFN